MAVGERATTAVLAGQAHRVAAATSERKGHVLAHAPVDVDLATAHRGAVVVHLLDQLVRVDAAGMVVGARPGASTRSAGMAVSPASVHFLPRKGSSPTAYLF